ncbi:DUF262 domain-containing protein [Arthrobacter sp. Cr_A7]|uniref:DUF262 domain-containing protein n=1 Tax=Arthrobacter sp. Cr_A7 TaxID=3031017 RepID=UPI0023DC020B|nr:DUF262 domain-containing protein [Arthrobacter sp. Cr_A7]MDF2050239.1 DUF262 domain-containing protein [Arthrobacter sp. Cr_A7]
MQLDRSELELESIVRRIIDGELDLQPDFQRGEIWDNRRRQRLIDSILRKWYVPAIHIVRKDDGTEVVLDGQQRLAAVRDFFTDKFSIDGTIDPHDAAIQHLHGKKFSQLPDQDRRALRRFALPIVTLKEFEPQEPNELFFRLNQSYNLTPPEKRNALHGRARDQVKDLVVLFADEGLLRHEAIGFSNGRLAYDDIIARTCVAVERRDLGQHINNGVVEEFYRSEVFTPETIAGVKAAGFELLKQVKASDGRIRFNKATLFTWLVYSFWSPQLTGHPLPENLLSRFELERKTIKTGDVSDSSDPIYGAVALYDDRASYRVTDVSSVLARDVVLHLYSAARFHTPSLNESHVLIREILRSRRDEVQDLTFKFIGSSNWRSVLSMTREGAVQ